MSGYSVPRPGEEGARLTGEQFADWYPMLTLEERVWIAEVLLEHQERSFVCASMDHQGWLEQQGQRIAELEERIRAIKERLEATD